MNHEEDLTIEEFADFVRFMRASIGLSQKKFAEEIGVSTGAVLKWENAKQFPKDLYPVIESIRKVVKLRLKSA